MAYEDFKDLTRRTASHKKSRDKAFNISKNSKYQRGFASMVYKFFDKKTSGTRFNIENILSSWRVTQTNY